MIGAEIYGYRIERAIAEDKGGFGDVYFARHVTSGAEAVLKVLKPEMSAHRDIVTRFFNEARAAAAIQHPGIVAVHNVGYVQERAYLLMERLRGEDLESRLKRGPLPVDTALRFLRQAAGAIGAAHERSIVHRDLKPANLFVVPDPDVVGGERIKVLDFGIAKLGTGGTMQTQGIFGTPAYMAPEQCLSSADVDPRSDLYSLGCIAYEMMSGQPPFGHGHLELIAAHLRDEPPPLRARAPAVPVAVEALTMRLLRKAREERFQTCAELIGAIDEAARGVTNAPPTRPAQQAGFAPTLPAIAAQPIAVSTTLGGSAGVIAAPAAPSAPPQPQRRGGPWVAIGVGAAVIAAAGITIVLATGGGSKTTPPPPASLETAAASTRAVAVDAAPIAVESPAPAAAAPPPAAAAPPPAAAAPPPSPVKNVDGFVATGNRDLNHNHFEAAQASFRAALAISPASEPALWGVAEAYRRAGQTAEAIDAYHAYLAVYPDSAKAKKQIERLTPRPATTAPASSGAKVTTPETAPSSGSGGGSGCDEVSCVIDGYTGPCCAKYKTAASGTHAAGGGTPASDIPDTLDRNMITQGVGMVKGRVAACGDKFPDAKGEVKIHVKVSPDGSVTSTSVDTAPDPGLGECVAAAMHGAHFVKTQQGGAFKYPFRF